MLFFDMNVYVFSRKSASDGMLVKRPVLVGDDVVLVGFKVKEWEEKLL
jgi:arsenate reductase-like glutaredoxin family protein